jgi:hypothetical protein
LSSTWLPRADLVMYTGRPASCRMRSRGPARRRGCGNEWTHNRGLRGLSAQAFVAPALALHAWHHRTGARVHVCGRLQRSTCSIRSSGSKASFSLRISVRVFVSHALAGFSPAGCRGGSQRFLCTVQFVRWPEAWHLIATGSLSYVIAYSCSTARLGAHTLENSSALLCSGCT